MTIDVAQPVQHAPEAAARRASVLQHLTDVLLSNTLFVERYDLMAYCSVHPICGKVWLDDMLLSNTQCVEKGGLMTLLLTEQHPLCGEV